MTTILAPTRGGKRSYPNQDGAVRIAKERNADILFLNVTNIEFLNQASSGVLVDLAHELEGLGEFILAMAQERAAKEGVTAKAIVKQGVFREVLREVLDEYPIDAIILGMAVDEDGHTNLDFLEAVANEISGESGVEFIILHHGEVVKTIQAQAGES
ncbi:MAG: universal stress protein [Chloroflexi bacterium]|nr:MAG: universal stress protein [Chloroflexota bacterium]MBL1194897.1 universal stress protein [Chloroflexota bacterium]NOH12188.1 universal stress protein [Chloroflexota bacterium]